MKQFWFVLATQANILFFAIMSILGIVYRGSEESNSYILFCGLSSVIAMILVVAAELRNKRKRSTFMYFLPLLFYMIEYFRTAGIYSDVPYLNRNTLVFLCFSIPAIFVGTHLANTDSFKESRKWFQVFMFVISIGLFFSFPKLRSSEIVSLSGSSYQAYSYMAAYCFGVNFYGLLEKELFQFKRFSIILVKAIRVFLLVLQIMSVFLGGGRGAVVLLVVSFVVLLGFKGTSFIKIAGYLVIITVVLLLGLRSMDSTLSDILGRGLERSFSYINNGIVDINETGRELVYEEAIKSIQRRPVFGYGLLGYLVPENYVFAYSPHNFFLEVLLQGGILYLLFVLSILVYLARKLFRIIRLDSDFSFLIPLALYPMISLQFSGDYLTTPMFWFCVSFIIAFDKTRIT